VAPARNNRFAERFRQFGVRQRGAVELTLKHHVSLAVATKKFAQLLVVSLRPPVEFDRGRLLWACGIGQDVLLKTNSIHARDLHRQVISLGNPLLQDAQ
jgi:hypothetical protein